MKTTNLLFKRVLPAILFFALLLSCEETTDKNEVKDHIEFVTVDMKKIPNVTVKNGDVVLGKSDKEGNFEIDQTKLKQNSTLVFEHKDYIKRYTVVNKNKLAMVTMKPRAKAIRINSKEGKTITTKSNVLVKIPQNAFNQNGKPYIGEVDITISSIDASNSFDIRSAPAPFIAQNSTGELVPLTSYGVVEVLAVTPKGTPLDLKKEVKIEISIPVTIEDTPEEVNLYEVNPETGYWVQAGVLVNMNSTLVGEITSVNSSWNADDPCSTALVCVRVKIVYSNGINHSCYGTYVGAEGLTYQGFDGHYVPDASGYVEFWVCPNSTFELQNCFLPCTCPGGNGPMHTKMIDLSTVTMNPSGCTDLGTWVIP